MSEQCERMSEWTSEWPSTYILIDGCSEPQCGVGVGDLRLLVQVFCPPCLFLFCRKRPGEHGGIFIVLFMSSQSFRFVRDVFVVKCIACFIGANCRNFSDRGTEISCLL